MNLVPVSSQNIGGYPTITPVVARTSKNDDGAFRARELGHEMSSCMGNLGTRQPHELSKRNAFARDTVFE